MKTNYSQPDFYKFNQDSTRLIQFVNSKLIGSPESVLDLGAGSGVLGIEFSFAYDSVKKLSFVEVQEAFFIHLKENVKLLRSSIEVDYVQSQFSKIDHLPHYDVILSNPPYYHKGDGVPSTLKERQIARGWEYDDLHILLKTIKNHLHSKGEAWLSLPSDKKTLKILESVTHKEIYPQSSELIYVRVLA